MRASKKGTWAWTEIISLIWALLDENQLYILCIPSVTIGHSI